MRAGRRRTGNALSRLLGAHLVLAGSWVTWRAIESTPSLASAWGGTFASSTAGRALAFATIAAAVVGLVAVVALTLPRWRDPRASGLFLALAAALVQRERVDVFDLVYVGLVAMIAVAWFSRRAATTVR